jgi:hypothetical protein
MKKIFPIFAVVALVVFLAAGARAGGLALLWVPQNDAPWQDFVAGMASAPGPFKMTLSVSPLVVTKAQRQQLQSLVQAGRMELPLRIMGDPVLPLLFSPSSPSVKWKGKEGRPLWNDRMDEAAVRLYAAVDGYKKSYSSAPAGWIPAGGGVPPEFLPLASAYGIKWIAAGAVSGSANDVVVSSGMSLIPFAMVGDTASLSGIVASAAVSSAPVFAVIDETLLGDDDAQNLRDAFFSLASATSPAVSYMTVSQALSVSRSTTAAELPPPWCGDYSPWAASLRQMGAFLNLGAARKAYAVSRISNSGASDALKQAAQDLAELDTGDRFLLLASTDTETADETERDYKGMLENIYREIGHPVPPSLVLPLSEDKVVDEDESDQSRKTVAKAAAATITEGDHMLLLENPVKTPNLPDSLSSGIDKDSAAKFFNTEALVISWDEHAVSFRIKNSRVDASVREALQPKLLDDIYIALNNRPFSGSVNLLEYRQLRTSPEDSWELALAVTARRARLFKATPQGPVLMGSYEPQQSEGGDIIVSVPRSIMSGYPPRWGYLVLSMALAVDKGSETPFKPVSMQESPILDYMALDKMGGTFYFLRLPNKFR